ncbi:MAG: sugar phosphate isomerase/epimerase, partial [Clostridia bacterium]|nr:sugar phosphate isomerase/epimerase [Clostridia bacterium]
DFDTVLAFFKPQAEAFKKYGLEIGQAHAPFPSLVADRPHVEQYSIRMLKNCIKLCDYYGVKNLVIHGTAVYAWDKYNTWENIDKLHLKLFSSLIPYLKGTCVTIGIENLFAENNKLMVDAINANPYKAAKLVDELNALCDGETHFGVCFDVGHLNLTHGYFSVFMEVLGKRITCLHVHDNGGVNDDHRMPYTGTVPWAEFIRELKKIGYDGNMNFETFHQYEVIPKELIPSALSLTAACGRYFIKQITGKEAE